VGHDLHHPQSPETFHPSQRPPEAATVQQMPGRDAYLDGLLGLLKPSGRLLCTGPNVAYWAMRKDLLLGRWDYQDTGIMDRTHLHFYNAKTWQELVERAGYKVEKFQSVEGMIPLEGRLQRMSRLRPLIAGLRNLAIGYAPSLFTIVYFMEAMARHY
jgi:Methyltransferase domain